MRLVILMGTQKSHFAYRLAWDNSFSERIPFLPLHRRDLVSAEEGNKTFIGEGKSRVNWKKFEVMGEVVLCIQRSQKTPYSQMHRYDDIQRLILDIKLAGDEEVCSTFLPPSLTFFSDIVTNKYRNCMRAACTSNHQPVEKPDARSSAGYARDPFLSPFTLPYPSFYLIYPSSIFTVIFYFFQRKVKATATGLFQFHISIPYSCDADMIFDAMGWVLCSSFGR